MTTRSRPPLTDFFTPFSGWRGLLLIVGLLLAWQALRDLPWDQAWGYVTGIGPSALLILLALNLLMLPLMSARWWHILKTMGSPVGLGTVCAYRFAANAVSFLTPGPHFGAEPLLAYLLYQRQQIPLPSAAASIALDRLLELLASIVVLSCSLIVLTAAGNGFLSGGWALFCAVSLLTALLSLLAALFTGRRPFSSIGSWLTRFNGNNRSAPPGAARSLLEAIMQGEAMAENLFHHHRPSFLLANLYALGHWLGVFAEFWLMAAFSGHPLSFLQLLCVVITARLAFFTPLPAGLGVLEIALPWITATLGLGSAFGLGLCLLIRVRDIFFGLAGLGLTMKYLTWPGKASTLTKNLNP